MATPARARRKTALAAAAPPAPGVGVVPALQADLADLAGPRLQGLPPVVVPHTRLLILGSFPGAASLQAQQYYAHPRNQFWPLLSVLLGVDLRALPYPSRLQQLCDSGLGLWDVYASCRRLGSLDSAIEEPRRNDLAALRALAPALQVVAHHGGVSARAMPAVRALGYEALRLPSTSPAHAGWSFERKLQAWRELFQRCAIVMA